MDIKFVNETATTDPAKPVEDKTPYCKNWLINYAF